MMHTLAILQFVSPSAFSRMQPYLSVEQEYKTQVRITCSCRLAVHMCMAIIVYQLKTSLFPIIWVLYIRSHSTKNNVIKSNQTNFKFALLKLEHEKVMQQLQTWKIFSVSQKYPWKTSKRIPSYYSDARPLQILSYTADYTQVNIYAYICVCVCVCICCPFYFIG